MDACVTLTVATSVTRNWEGGTILLEPTLNSLDLLQKVCNTFQFNKRIISMAPTYNNLNDTI